MSSELSHGLTRANWPAEALAMPQALTFGQERRVLGGVRSDAVDVVHHRPQILTAALRGLPALTCLGEGRIGDAHVAAQAVQPAGRGDRSGADEPVQDAQLGGG